VKQRVRAPLLVLAAALSVSLGVLGLGGGQDAQTQPANRPFRVFLPGLVSNPQPTPVPPTVTPTRSPSPAAAATPTGLVYCTVSSVTDGDTIKVTGCADAGTVRLILIDTPEVFFGAECYGKEASNYTKSL